MQNPESVEIGKRFFAVLAELKKQRLIRGRKTFTDRYSINRWNLNTLEKEPHRDMWQLVWFKHLVQDYGVCPRWLLTGEGEMFSNPPVATTPPNHSAGRSAKRQ